jgi:hypothetical protein
MLLSACQRQTQAQEFVNRLAEQRDQDMSLNIGERRCESRIDLSVAVWVIPMYEECPEIGKSFIAVTKDVSPGGLALLTYCEVRMPQIVVCFSGKNQSVFLRATVRGQKSLGLGCFRLSLEVTEIVDTDAYPQLRHFLQRILTST